MATGLARPLTRSLKGRMFSAAAAQAEGTKAADRENEPKCYVKKLSNGLIVGTVETPSPITRLAVVTNAGSRFETGESLGITHVLRHAAKIRTQNLSSLGISRMAQQLGSDITCEVGRENIFYKSNVTRNCVGKVVEILREISTKHHFKPWEVSDIQSDPNGIGLDLAVLNTQPQIRLMEQLHAAAFRNTLGQSLYAPEFAVGKFNPEQLMHYVKTYFGVGRLALVGVGIEHTELEALGALFEPYASSGVPTEKAVYHGGEIRTNTGGELAYVAVAFGGPSQTSKELLPSEVLKHIMGVGTHIKYGSGTVASQLGKAVAQAMDGPFHVSGMNANYSDAGLFGFSAISHASQIDRVVRAASKQFKTVATSGVSEEQVANAKTHLKAEICMQFENPDVLLGWLGEQALNSDQILTPEEVYQMVDSVSTSDVNNVAKKIVASKPSLSAIGNIEQVPYLDQIFSN